MAQFLRPNLDVQLAGWTDQAGGTVDTFTSINEEIRNDADYIESGTNPSNALAIYGLSSGGDPESSAGHIFRYVIGKDQTGGRTIDGRVDLVEFTDATRTASTTIATWDHPNMDAFAQFDRTLTDVQADSIANYGLLGLQVNANTQGTGPARRARFTWNELETPDAAAPPGPPMPPLFSRRRSAEKQRATLLRM